MENWTYASATPWWMHKDSIQKVVIEEGVTSVGVFAFYTHPALVSVHIPASVTTIGNSAFSRGAALTGIYVDGANACYSSDEYGVLFNKDKTLLIKCPTAYAGTTYTIPASVTEIYGSAFLMCGLQSIEIPKTVTAIGAQAFQMCASLTKVTVYNPEAVFGTYVFSAAHADLVIHGYTNSAAEAYATANGHTFEAIQSAGTIELPAIAMPSGTTVTAPAGGWVEGTNTFSVDSSNTCVVIVSYDGGATYQRLTASVKADGSYEFTADNVTSDTVISVELAGDISGDGVVNITDVNRLRVAQLGKITLPW